MAYFDSEPQKLTKNVFQLYQYVHIEQNDHAFNTGIMVEDGCFEFMFVKEKNVKIQIRDSAPIYLPQQFCLGKLPLPYKFIFPGTLSLFAIKIQPWASHFFFSFPYTEVIDLFHRYGEKIYFLHHDIFSAVSFEEMVARVESFFSKEDLPELKDYEITKKICESILEKKGDLLIKNLIRETALHRQKLNRLFFSQTYNSIKEFAMYTRIRAVLEYKIKHPQKSLTEVGLRFGYFDQSHFIRDFKKSTGLTPSHFFSTYNLYHGQIKLKD